MSISVWRRPRPGTIGPETVGDLPAVLPKLFRLPGNVWQLYRFVRRLTFARRASFAEFGGRGKNFEICIYTVAREEGAEVKKLDAEGNGGWEAVQGVSHIYFYDVVDPDDPETPSPSWRMPSEQPALSETEASEDPPPARGGPSERTSSANNRNPSLSRAPLLRNFSSAAEVSGMLKAYGFPRTMAGTVLPSLVGEALEARLGDMEQRETYKERNRELEVERLRRDHSDAERRIADADRRIADAVAQADRRVADAVAQADRRVAEAEGHAVVLAEGASMVCLLCMNAVRSKLCQPCRHLCCCEGCSVNLLFGKCPICRGVIREMEKVYFC